jgi:hypothetical protein
MMTLLILAATSPVFAAVEEKPWTPPAIAIPDERTAVAVAIDIYNAQGYHREAPWRFEDFYHTCLSPN